MKHFIKPVIFLLAFFVRFIPLPAFAQAAETNLLWEIKGVGNTYPSYIFASFQTTDISFTDNLESVKKTLVSCDNFAGLSPAAGSLDKASLVLNMQMQENSSLKKILSKDKLRVIDQLALSTLGEPILDFNSVKPLFIRSLLIDTRENPAGAKFLGDRLADVAIENGKNMLALVTLRQQAIIYERLSPPEQAEILYDYASHINEFKEAFNAMKSYYRNGDLNALRNTFEDVERPVFIEQIVDRTTDRIVRKIEQYILEGSTFFCVPAEHFEGDNGILKLLSERGLQLIPVELDDLRSDMPQDLSVAPIKKAVAQEQIIQNTNHINEPVNKPTEKVRELKDQPVSRTRLPTQKVQSGNVLVEVSSVDQDPFGQLLGFSENDTSFLKEWYELSMPGSEFYLKMPYEPIEKKSRINTGGGKSDITIFSLNDLETNLYYMFSYSDYPPGFKIKSKYQFFNQSVNDAVSQLKGKLIAERVISEPLYTGREFVMVADGNLIRSRIFLAGNRLYQVMTAGSPEDVYSVSARAFLGSFSLKKFQDDKWFDLVDESYAISMPERPKISFQSVNTEFGEINIKLNSLSDDRNGALYFLSVSDYPKSFEVKNLKTFYSDAALAASNTFNSRILSEENTLINGEKAKLIKLIDNGGRWYRIEMLFHDNKLFQIICGGTSSSIDEQKLNFFFNSFRLID